MVRRSIRFRRRGRRHSGGGELQLTSLMDALVIIVVFLLKSFSISNTPLTMAQGLTLPNSESQEAPPDSPQIVITPEAIVVENERVLDFVQTEADLESDKPKYRFKGTDLDEGGKRIIPVYDALVKAREKAELTRARANVRDAEGKPLPFDAALAIQADKAIEYDTVKKVMYTAGAAGYRVFRFIGLSKEGS